MSEDTRYTMTEEEARLLEELAELYETDRPAYEALIGGSEAEQDPALAHAEQLADWLTKNNEQSRQIAELFNRAWASEASGATDKQ